MTLPSTAHAECVATARKSGLADTKVELFGISIDSLSMDEAVEQIASRINTGTFCYAVTPNVDHIMKLRRDDSFKAAYERASFVFADGVPLLWAAKLLRRPLRGRINGTDLFERLCKLAEESGYTIFLLGGNEGTAEAAAHALTGRYPRLKIAGLECPIYGFHRSPQACQAIQNQIASSKADILFVGLGAPKQEQWILQYGEGAGVSFAVGIGVSFSFIAGEIRRAPKWMQRRGLEWAWRLFMEPSRLWKRYLLDDIAFVPLTFSEWIRRMLSHANEPPSPPARPAV